MTADQVVESGQSTGLAQYIILGLTVLFTFGATLQLFIAGLSTFDSGLYWSDHVSLGRAIAPMALLLPFVALFGRLGRRTTILGAAVAVLYILQVLFTYTDIGPLAAVHALNTIPLLVIPVMLGLEAWRVVRNSPRQDD